MLTDSAPTSETGNTDIDSLRFEGKSARPLRSPCSECRLRKHCFPAGMSDSDVRQFGEVVFSHRRVKQGHALYRSGDPCNAFYLMRFGFIKTLVTHPDGREQVAAFYMAGEMLGLDGIATGKHASDAVALTDVDVCVVPLERLEHLCHEQQTVQRYVTRLFSQEVVHKQSMLLLLGSMRAEERVAAFLLNLSQRFTAQGYSASDFVLCMTREEIGSLLGMKLETVSRIFSKFQKTGLLSVNGRHVRIENRNGLRTMLGH
jgi:CRP/FNR family transcriptional regulator, anaerobic regulatory protein